MLPEAATTTMPFSTALLRGQRQRILEVRLGDRRAHRHVHDADVVRALVADRPLERQDDVADDPLALRVEHLQADDVRARRDPARDPYES